MRYFSYFPTFETSNGEQARDIFLRLKIHELVLSQSPIFYDYQWKDSDRPDILAEKYYNDPALYWVVFYSNNAFDLNYDFPLRNEEFEKYLIEKYGSAEEAAKLTHAFEQLSTGLQVDYKTALTLNGDVKVVSAYDYELEMNEMKRNIKLLSRASVSAVQLELEKKLRQARNAK